MSNLLRLNKKVKDIQSVGRSSKTQETRPKILSLKLYTRSGSRLNIWDFFSITGSIKSNNFLSQGTLHPDSDGKRTMYSLQE